jgi:hypothetical protein
LILSYRNGTFLDRILEAIVAVCAVLFFMGGSASFAVIGGVAVALRIYRMWQAITARGEC